MHKLSGGIIVFACFSGILALSTSIPEGVPTGSYFFGILMALIAGPYVWELFK